MIIGAILQAAANGYAMMIVARVVTGLGNGLNVRSVPCCSSHGINRLQTSTVPAYHAECSPAANRGALIMIEGALITFGIMISCVFARPGHEVRSNIVCIDMCACFNDCTVVSDVNCFLYFEKWIDFAL